jgi:hypothetical protein
MSHEDPGNIQYNEVGGLQEQIRELREVGTLKHSCRLLLNCLATIDLWMPRSTGHW